MFLAVDKTILAGIFMYAFFRVCLSVWLLDVQCPFRLLLLLLLYFSLDMAVVYYLPYTV